MLVRIIVVPVLINETQKGLVSFACSGQVPPQTSPACLRLDARLEIQSLWASGYMVRPHLPPDRLLTASSLSLARDPRPLLPHVASPPTLLPRVCAQARILIGDWQEGARLNLHLDADGTRNVYLESVEVDGKAAEASSEWHHKANIE